MVEHAGGEIRMAHEVVRPGKADAVTDSIRKAEVMRCVSAEVVGDQGEVEAQVEVTIQVRQRDGKWDAAN